MSKINLAVFASGAGTNADAIAQHFKDHDSIRVGLIVTNKAEAGVMDVADRNKIASIYLPKSELQDEEMVSGILDEFSIDYIILAGWLLLVPTYLVDLYPSKILNIHPALLPKFGGRGMYGSRVHEAVKAAHESESGITIHEVNNRYDEGEIVAQFKVEILESDGVADIERKVRALELIHYPSVIENFILS